MALPLPHAAFMSFRYAPLQPLSLSPYLLSSIQLTMSSVRKCVRKTILYTRLKKNVIRILMITIIKKEHDNLPIKTELRFRY